jgi:hypothetical protein
MKDPLSLYLDQLKGTFRLCQYLNIYIMGITLALGSLGSLGTNVQNYLYLIF